MNSDERSFLGARNEQPRNIISEVLDENLEPQVARDLIHINWGRLELEPLDKRLRSLPRKPVPYASPDGIRFLFRQRFFCELRRQRFCLTSGSEFFGELGFQLFSSSTPLRLRQTAAFVHLRWSFFISVCQLSLNPILPLIL